MADRFAPPPLKPGESLVFQVAFRDGRAYAAPIGSPLDFHEAWFRIDSLEALAGRLGVSFESPRAEAERLEALEELERQEFYGE